ncbi:MAG: 30S ribosomal protein S7 [Dehalococcoidales bacterium]|nr:30S ribosomal protein S7 [Dehalococcoidales bacterium]
MPRRALAIKRETPSDNRYHSEVVARLVSKLMRCGKRNTAEVLVYGALQSLEKQESKDAVGVLEQAVKNSTPLLMVKARRIGGATYQVPVEVRPELGLSLAMRWLVQSAKSRSGKSMAEKLAAEINDAAKGEGATIKKREDTHRMAEANRAFAHFRW